jgi:hypothetical protein
VKLKIVAFVVVPPKKNLPPRVMSMDVADEACVCAPAAASNIIPRGSAFNGIYSH